MDKFILNEPNRELTEGYFTALMKYSVIFLIAWMFGQLLIFTYPCIAWSGEKYPPTLTWLNNYNIISWILVLLGTYFYVISQIKKYSLPLVTTFRFNATQEQLNLELLNTFSGKTSQTSIPYNQLKIDFETKENTWYGKQRVYRISSNEQTIAQFNIEKTAWKQFPEIEGLVIELNKHIA
jgi:hypothetical protein